MLCGILLAAGSSYAGVLDASWIAPTTNTDGSPLTDLIAYRVYYGSATSPCPGPSGFEIPSPTSSPAPNTTVSFRLTGLTAGTLYYVAVTAVDGAGNESACSLAASAVAQPIVSVSPTGTVNFGSVSVGGFADRTLTIQTTRNGAVTGAVSASPPFSVVSGSPFSLSGAGATQAVTVRFTPTSPATFSTNVIITASGDTISRTVAGIGTTLSGTFPPSVAITAPPGPAYTTTGSQITLAGIASTNVTRVTWSNNRGGSGTAAGTTNWTVSAVALQPGANVLTVRAQDAAGNVATATLTASRTTPVTFTDDPLVPASTVVRAVHFTELRAAIDGARTTVGLMPFAWTDPTLSPGSTRVRSIHYTELKNALNEAYQRAGRALPTYSGPSMTVGSAVVQANQLAELRAAVLGLM